MYLHRVTRDPYESYSYHPGGKFLGMSSEDFRADQLEFDGQPTVDVVAIRFKRFGGGKYRQSDYDVLTEWKDVEKIIDEFCYGAHPEAVALREAVKLATAAKQLGWKPPLPQSK